MINPILLAAPSKGLHLAASPIPIPPPTNRPNGALVRVATNPGLVLHHLVHTVLAHLDHAEPALHHALVPLVAIAAVVLAISIAALVAQRAEWRRGGHFIEIAPPAHPDPRGGLACWRMLAPLLTGRHTLGGRRPPVAFECVGDEGGLTIGLWTSKTLSAESVIETIESAWPGARAVVAETHEIATRRGGRRVGGSQARLGSPEWFALGGTDSAAGDPLRAVFVALVDGSGSGRAMFQVLARPAAGKRVARARAAARSLRRGEPTSGGGGAVGGVGGAVGSLARFVAGRTPPTRSSTNDPLAQSDVRVVTEKVNNPPHFEVAVRYAIEGEPGRVGRRIRRRRLRQLGAALGLFTGRNHLVGRVLLRAAAVLRNRRVHRGFLCSAPELAALAHLPEEPPAYGMRAAPARTVLPPRNVSGGGTNSATWGAGEVDDVA